MDDIPGKRFEKGEVIFSEGDEPDALYMILSGKVDISQGEGGLQKSLTLLQKGSVFGEMALINHAPRSATATAETEVECLVVSIAEFYRLMEATHPILQKTMQVLSGRLRSTTQLVAEAEAEEAYLAQFEE